MLLCYYSPHERFSFFIVPLSCSSRNDLDCYCVSYPVVFMWDLACDYSFDIQSFTCKTCLLSSACVNPQSLDVRITLLFYIALLALYAWTALRDLCANCIVWISVGKNFLSMQNLKCIGSSSYLKKLWNNMAQKNLVDWLRFLSFWTYEGYVGINEKLIFGLPFHLLVQHLQCDWVLFRCVLWAHISIWDSCTNFA